MLDQEYFYFDLQRKYNVVFGSIFNEVYIERLDPTGNTNQIIKVPLEYGPKDKLLSRIKEDPEIDRPYAALTPRMSFEMGDPVYLSAEQIPKLNTVKAQSKTQPGAFNHQYTRILYEFPFTLYILAKNIEDGNKIIEQVLPFFRPEYTVQVELIPEMSPNPTNIPIIYTGLRRDDEWEGDFKKRRSIVWALSFKMKAPLFGPITQPGIIKFVRTTFYLPPADSSNPRYISVAQEANSTPLEAVTGQVTLTANGQPTSNAAQSIPVKQINITDDFGYASYVTNIASDQTPNTVTIV